MVDSCGCESHFRETRTPTKTKGSSLTEDSRLSEICFQRFPPHSPDFGTSGCVFNVFLFAKHRCKTHDCAAFWSTCQKANITAGLLILGDKNNGSKKAQESLAFPCLCTVLLKHHHGQRHGITLRRLYCCSCIHNDATVCLSLNEVDGNGETPCGLQHKAKQTPCGLGGSIMKQLLSHNVCSYPCFHSQAGKIPA